MPRGNPEVITGYQTWSYKHYVNGTFGGSSTYEAFKRSYTGGEPTADYPRRLVYHQHSVFKMRQHATDYFTCHRRNATNSVYDIQTDAIYGTFTRGTFRTPLVSPYMQGDVAHDSTARQAAINRAMDAVVDQKVNLAQAFAERAQTVRLIEETASRLSKAIVHLRRGRVAKAADALGIATPKKAHGTVAQQWLGFQYGWKPLLSDVKGSAEALAQSYHSRPLSITVRGYRKVIAPAFYGTTIMKDNGGTDIGRYFFSFGPRTTEARTKLAFVVSSEFARLGKRLGISDPFTLAWELMPWSFVVDWFIPIGDFIGKMNYDSGLQYAGGCTTLHTTQFLEWGAVSGVYPIPWGNAYLTNLRNGRKDLLRMDRELHTSPPRPVLPKFQDPFNPTRVLNALALMRTNFKSFR